MCMGMIWVVMRVIVFGLIMMWCILIVSFMIRIVIMICRLCGWIFVVVEVCCYLVV